MPGKEKIKPRKKNTRQGKNTRTEIRQNKTERNCQTSIKNKGKNFRQENIPGKEKIKPRKKNTRQGKKYTYRYQTTKLDKEKMPGNKTFPGKE